MGKEKSIESGIKNNKVPKTARPDPERKIHKPIAIKKLQSKNKKEDHEFDDMGSLIFLKEMPEKKKLKGVDERIKVLKNELKSLFHNIKSDKDKDFTINGTIDTTFNSNKVLDIDKVCKISSQGLESNWMKTSEYCEDSNTSVMEDIRPSSSSTPSKFSVWLDKTIDEMDSQIQKEKLTNGDSGQNSILQLDLTKPPSPLTSDLIPEVSYKFSLPQNEVEKLVYKSFVLQNSEIYLSSSEESSSEQVKSANTIKQQKFKRSRKQYITPKEKAVQGSTGKCHKFYKRGRKRRLISRNASLSNTEVINLDNSSSFIEVPKVNSAELDLNNYDWNEPFDLDDNTEFYLDVEIIDSEHKNDTKLSNQNMEISTSEFLESDQSGCCKKDGKLQQKGVWECPVCFEQAKGQEVVATQCGHVFCKKCLENHTSKLNKNCPTCRSDLKDKPFITLFNF